MRSFVLFASCLVVFAGCGSSATSAATSASDSKASDSKASDTVDAGGGELGDTASDTPSSDTASKPTLTSDIMAFCKPWAAMACKRALGCGCTTPKDGALTDKLCTPYMEVSCLDDMKKLNDFLAPGVLSLDVAKAEQCVAWIDTTLQGCIMASKGALRPGPCYDMMVQVPGPAGECAAGNLACADGSGCVGKKCGVVRLPDGSACSSDGQCQSLLCDSDTSTCMGMAKVGGACSYQDSCPPATGCVGGVCVEAKKLGDACAASDEIPCGIGLVCSSGKCASVPKSCTAPDQCGQANACLGTVYNQCQPRLGLGKACTQDGECQADLWCDPAAKLCTAKPAIGSPCANGVLCAPGAVCQETPQTCVAMPGDGQACGMGENGPFLCGPGLVCKADAFICGPPPAAGANCNNHANCSVSAGKDKDALVCAFGPTGSQCVAKQPVGTHCENDICQDGAFCNFATLACTANFATGTPCKDGNECGTQGSCVPDKTGTLRCAPMPGQGQDCLFDCQSGLYCSKGVTGGTCQPPICNLFYTLK